MGSLIHPREKTLFVLSVIIATILWLIPIFLSYGVVLLLLPFFYLSHLFIQSYFISHIRANGVKVSENQFPDVYQQFKLSCKKLNLPKEPDIYILQGDGLLNAFAAKFSRRYYVVLFSDVVDSLDDAKLLNFYIGHELGHIKRNHMFWSFYLSSASIFPLLYPAYSRACEYTCDRHGLACCEDVDDAMRGMALLAAGKKGWKNINIEQYISQSDETGGFWLTFNELVSTYPWLCKRIAWLKALAKNTTPDLPKRSFFARLVAAFSPRPDRSIFMFIIAIIFAVWFQEQVFVKPVIKEVASAVDIGEIIVNLVAGHTDKKDKLPESLEELSLSSKKIVAEEKGLKSIEYTKDGKLTLTLKSSYSDINNKTIIFYIKESGEELLWYCDKGTVDDDYRPERCQK